MVKAGSSPIRSAYSRRSRAPIPWNVPAQVNGQGPRAVDDDPPRDALNAPGHFGGGATRKGHQQYSTGIGTVDDEMRDPVSQGVGLSGTRAGDDEERRTRCSVFLTHTMLDSSSLFAVEAFKISNGHWWQICQRRSRYSTTILVLFANGSVNQAWALKVSAVPGATHNRISSNRYRHRSADAGVGPPRETPVAVKRDARVSCCIFLLQIVENVRKYHFGL